MMNWSGKYQWRHALSSSAALLLAITVGYFLNIENIIWAAIGALLAIQTSRGTPARQALYSGFVAVLAIIAGFYLSHYVIQLELYMTALMGSLLICSFMLMLRQPASLQTCLLWLVPPLVMMVSALWPAVDEMMLANRLALLATGGLIGLLCGLLVLPVQQYHEFRLGVAPILKALIDYSIAMKKSLLNQSDLKAPIELVIKARRQEYPEWVFEPGFNRGFRSSFRYVLVQLEKISESFFSLDYHIRQVVDPAMMSTVSPYLASVVEGNQTLLMVVYKFFAGESIEIENDNFTDDLTALHQALDKVLPASAELLDLSPHYINLSALARDVIDVRELLLQVVAGLPINNFNMPIKSGSGI